MTMHYIHGIERAEYAKILAKEHAKGTETVRELAARHNLTFGTTRRLLVEAGALEDVNKKTFIIRNAKPDEIAYLVSEYNAGKSMLRIVREHGHISKNTLRTVLKSQGVHFR